MVLTTFEYSISLHWKGNEIGHASNEEIAEVVPEIPQGHRHLRTMIVLQDGREFTFHEATIAKHCARLPYDQDAS